MLYVLVSEQKTSSEATTSIRSETTVCQIVIAPTCERIHIFNTWVSGGMNMRGMVTSEGEGEGEQTSRLLTQFFTNIAGDPPQSVVRILRTKQRHYISTPHWTLFLNEF